MCISKIRPLRPCTPLNGSLPKSPNSYSYIYHNDVSATCTTTGTQQNTQEHQEEVNHTVLRTGLITEKQSKQLCISF